MTNRWAILALLFVVRFAMGFQFQIVAATAPLIESAFAVGVADVGVLIGLYLLPGVAIALPGGALGRRFGEKTIVLAGLALMIAGGATMAWSATWQGQIAGRLLCGTGGVLLNVLMSSMAQAWFQGREIATAMAIFANAWPAGIAVALIVMPALAESAGLASTHLLAAGYAAVALLLLGLLYRSPPVATGVPAARQERLSGGARASLVTAALIWALYNVGFSMMFSFAPLAFAQTGASVVAAGSLTSIVLWATIVSIPFGGLVADRTGRNDTVLAVSCVATAVALALMARLPQSPVTLAVLGAVFGLAAGPILALPSRVLTPATRAFGRGLFFTIFYIGNGLGPMIGGAVAAWAGTARAALDLGVACFVLCPLLLWLFRAQVAAQQPARVQA
jgi:MFS family permease